VGFLRLCCATLILECEVNSRARHPEIVVSTINNVPAEILIQPMCGGDRSGSQEI
jgi:hypothetical protein